MDENTEDTGPSPKKRKRRLWRWALGALASAAALLAAAVWVASAVLVSREWTYSADLAASLPPDILPLFTNSTLEASARVSRHETWDYVAAGRGRALDWPFSFNARVNYDLLPPSANGTGTLSFDGTPWRAELRFAWSARDGWSAELSLPEVAFDQDDAIAGGAARRFATLANGISGLAFSGKARFSATAASTNASGVAVWEADGWIKDFDISLMNGPDKVEAKKFGVHVGATGIGDHVDPKPAFPHLDYIDYAGFAVSNLFVSVRSTETALLVTEAGADIWGGTARIYSCFLNPEKLAAGFTLFIDDIDTGPALERLTGFDGVATGRLHGKLPLSYDGKRLAINDSYLYSTPGERGTLKVRDSAPLVNKLAYAGVGDSERDNMVRALKNMTYDALSITLRREDESHHALKFKLEGTATEGKTTVPAVFDVTLHGKLEELINKGIGAAILKETLK